jgi:hypothetical protein
MRIFFVTAEMETAFKLRDSWEFLLVTTPETNIPIIDLAKIYAESATTLREIVSIFSNSVCNSVSLSWAT